MNFPTTTLLIVDCLNVNVAIKVIERCKRLCNFADVKFLTSLPTDYPHIEIAPLNTLVAYSIFMLKKAHEYIDTKHLLIVQRDGWILNHQSWKDEWYQYDYIGALFNQYDVMGVGGVSFRSKALMESVSKKLPQWDGSEQNVRYLQSIVGQYEDGHIAIALRRRLEMEGFKFASLEDAAMFSAGGNPNPKYHYETPFAFHGAWREFDQVTGIVKKEIKVHDLPEPL